MSTYQQPPYQKTVMQPMVVQPVLPVVVPIVSGHNTGYNRGPAHIRNGAKLGPCNVNGGCICFMSVYGAIMMSMALLFLFIFDVTCSDSPFDHTICPFSIPVLIMGGIGAPFAIISCYLCIKAKKKYNKERSQENTAPYSEPFTQPAPPVYVPVAPGAIGVSYPNAGLYYQPGGAQYLGPPSHQVPDKSFVPEYNQQPSYAPPSYSP